MRIFEITLAEGTMLSSVAHAVVGMLEQENMETRILTTLSEEYVIQAHSRNGQILRWIGMDRHMTVTLSPCGPGCVRVRTVRSRWLFSRSILFLTGLLVICWPLIITTAVGAIRSLMQERRIRRFLQGKGPPDEIRVVYHE